MKASTVPRSKGQPTPPGQAKAGLSALAETSIWLGGNLSGDPTLGYATSGTAQTSGHMVNGGNAPASLMGATAPSGRVPAPTAAILWAEKHRVNGATNACDPRARTARQAVAERRVRLGEQVAVAVQREAGRGGPGRDRELLRGGAGGDPQRHRRVAKVVDAPVNNPRGRYG